LTILFHKFYIPDKLGTNMEDWNHLISLCECGTMWLGGGCLIFWDSVVIMWGSHWKLWAASCYTLYTDIL
jgi:hypothetical protein